MCVCGGQVVGCLPVFSLARLHTAAWQRRAGQLNSFGKEEESKRGKGRRGGAERWRDFRGETCLSTHVHSHACTMTHSSHLHTLWDPEGCMDLGANPISIPGSI